MLTQRFQAKPAVSVSATWSPLLLAADASWGRAASPGSALPRGPPCLPPSAFGAFNLPESRPDWPVSHMGEMEPEPGHDGEVGVGCPLPSSSVPPSPIPPSLPFFRPQFPHLSSGRWTSAEAANSMPGGAGQTDQERVGLRGLGRFPRNTAPWGWSPRFLREARNPGLHWQSPDFLN